MRADKRKPCTPRMHLLIKDRLHPLQKEMLLNHRGGTILYEKSILELIRIGDSQTSILQLALIVNILQRKNIDLSVRCGSTWRLRLEDRSQIVIYDAYIQQIRPPVTPNKAPCHILNKLCRLLVPLGQRHFSNASVSTSVDVCHQESPNSSVQQLIPVG